MPCGITGYHSVSRGYIRAETAVVLLILQHLTADFLSGISRRGYSSYAEKARGSLGLGKDESMAVYPKAWAASVLELSRMLSVNVNTVKRAFDELEHDGVIVSVQGRGSFVAENALASGQLQRRYMEQAEFAVRAARAGGVLREDLIRLVDKVYEKEAT